MISSRRSSRRRADANSTTGRLPSTCDRLSFLFFSIVAVSSTSTITSTEAFTTSRSSPSIPFSSFHRQHRTLPSFHQNSMPPRSGRNTQLHLHRWIPKNSFGALELSNVFYDDMSTAFDAWEWTANMGAPAALVAGAVLVTLSETREQLVPRRFDKKWIRFLKRLMRLLLLSSFAMEVVSIFVGTMTGSVLLGHGSAASVGKKLAGYESPLQLLHHHHEFEYLMTQICFLQGLFHWLGAVACEFLLPKPTETKSARRMNRGLACWLVSLIFWILAFYNNHLNFYSDYATMLWRFVVLFKRDYTLFQTPIRPMSLLYAPSFLLSTFFTWRAFNTPPEEDEDEEEESSPVNQTSG
mmetsp:Transcript_60443/g.148319  ORF Transcript_60443/g.148319 Transcript_60443/m.148319 type:complete len:353 (-) Transcript_60443:167-1225(-)